MKLDEAVRELIAAQGSLWQQMTMNKMREY